MAGISKVTALIKSREGKNSYTQSYLREQVFNGYSDCSSLVWKCYEKGAGIFVGTWTGQQIDKGVLVFRNGKKGKKGLTQEDLPKMKEGDLVFWGPSRGDSRHVEYYVGNNQLSGHGSGIGPVRKTATAYRHSYQLLEVRRYIGQSGQSQPVKNYLARGDKGAQVASMQTMLIYLGYSCGNFGADGDYGDYTEAAVRSFQKAKGLEADGIYGAKTRKELLASYEKASEKGDSASSSSEEPSKRKVLYSGLCTGNNVNVRIWAGTEYANIKSYPILSKGDEVEVLDYTQQDITGEDWNYVRIQKTYYGFVKAEFIEKAEEK